MNAIFESNLRLVKATDTSKIDWSADEVQSRLKVLVVALLADSQEDLILASSLSQLTAPQLKDMTRIKHQYTTKTRDDDTAYDIHSITFGFPNRVYRNQSFTFISASTATRNKSQYNTLIMTHSTPKLTSMLLHWIKTQYGVINKPLTFDSKFILGCLDLIVNGLPGQDKTRLGDVELTFQTHTRSGALNSINIELENKEILKFASVDEKGLLIHIMSFLKENTSIEFERLPITRFKCKFLVITSDGRLRFLRGIPTISSTEVIEFTAWDFVQKIYDSL